MIFQGGVVIRATLAYFVFASLVVLVQSTNQNATRWFPKVPGKVPGKVPTNKSDQHVHKTVRPTWLSAKVPRIIRLYIIGIMYLESRASQKQQISISPQMQLISRG